ncbi:MAG TPA: YqiA/YcfP family alpha/beta fold hydrolase [Casimicrobiaceae bacterium]
MIVYLHGFRSSPASRKARVLSDAVAALPASMRPVLHVPELTDGPSAAIASVLDLVRDADPNTLSFVGSSLGGFYATCLAERLGARAVLVNPAVRPYDDLRPYVGVQVNLYTGAEFVVTERHFEELRALAVPRISHPERFLLLAQTGDEVLDYRAAMRFYAGAWQWLQGGGDHGFVGFETALPAVLRFCGVVRRN